MNTGGTNTKLFLIILTLSSLLGACNRAEPRAEAQPAQPSEIRAKLSTLQTNIVENSSEFIATLESRRSVTIQPRIQGQVSQIFVRSGDRVTEGTPIIQVDPAEQQASVNSFTAGAQAAQAELRNAQATLSSLEAQRLSRVSELKLNELQYQRYSNLYNEGAVSQQVRDQYASSVDVARANLNALNRQIQAQQAVVTGAEKSYQQALSNIKQQQVQLQYYTIKAPFTSTVGDIPVKVGDFVNTSTQLTTITQNQPLEVNISIPNRQVSWLRLGMPVELLNEQNKIISTSKVFFISPNIKNTTQTVLAKSLFANPNNLLRANEQVRVKVVWNQEPGVLVPTTAVSRVAGQNFVFVVQKEKSGLVAKQKLVQLGNIQGNNYQVISGLKPGERVATTNVPNLSDGAAIIPES
jgi:multidrug efflux pump subunit AcrA (membrane-fusion protein)